MPDTETLDRVLDIITRVPHLHDQASIAAWVRDPAAARQELAAAPDVRRLVAPEEMEWPTHSCGSAYCVGGWVLIVKGYTERNWVFYPPGVAPGTPGTALADPLAAAERELGIDLRVLDPAGGYLPTLFSGGTTLPQIRAWVAFYKGEIDQDTLVTLLELHMEEG